MHDDRIIAIETSGRQGSVAIATGPDLLADRPFPTDREHARDLLPAIDRLCHDAGWTPGDIGQCYLSIGPGSFTGLRLGVTFARHFALATGARLCAVPTLDVIAQNGLAAKPPPPHVGVLLDAKRKQVFAGVFQKDNDRYQRIRGPALIEPLALLRATPQPLAVLGEGIAYHRVAVDAADVSVLPEVLWHPRASVVHRLGWELAQAGAFTPPRDLVPLYVRRPEVEEVWERRHGHG